MVINELFKNEINPVLDNELHLCFMLLSSSDNRSVENSNKEGLSPPGGGWVYLELIHFRVFTMSNKL